MVPRAGAGHGEEDTLVVAARAVGALAVVRAVVREGVVAAVPVGYRVEQLDHVVEVGSFGE